MNPDLPLRPVALTLGGHLSYFETHRRTHLQISLAQRAALNELLTQLEIPVSEVWLVVVNGEKMDLAEAWIAPGDKVELYSPMGGG
jgi:hypothetical protein